MSIIADVILPTYNGEKYLPQQIESILSQSHTELRLIIRDDGSTDHTVDIIKNYQAKDTRIQIIKDERGNLGLVKSIELLLGISSSEVVFMADQDDVWYPNKIGLFLNHYTPTDVPTLLHSDCMVTEEDLSPRHLFLPSSASGNGLANAFFNFFVQGASAMVNRALIQKSLPFPEKVYIHDRYLHLMAETFGKRVYIPEPTMLYRQHGTNLIGSTSFLKKIRNNLSLRSFYLKPDHNLILEIAKKDTENTLFDVYKKLTSSDVSRFEKVALLLKNKIPMRLKEQFFLMLKN